jgi:hypothetical protein
MSDLHQEHEPHWLKKIVSDIKEKDHDAAVALRQREHNAEVLKTRGPIFWNAFGDFLKMFVGEMMADFGSDVTATQIGFTISSQTRAIQIAKEAFPFAALLATPVFTGGPNNVQFKVFNPERPAPNSAFAHESLPSRFEVVGEDVELQLNGHMFKQPEDAARFMIKKLFTV